MGCEMYRQGKLNKENVDGLKNGELITLIQDIFKEHRICYDIRRFHKELLNRAKRVNHKKVQRLMRKLELKGKFPKEKYHSYVGEVGKITENLVNREFTTMKSLMKPLEKWTSDVTQFSLPWGKCYLSPILDMHTNEIISFNLSQKSLTNIEYYNNKKIQAKNWMPPLLYRMASKPILKPLF